MRVHRLKSDRTRRNFVTAFIEYVDGRPPEQNGHLHPGLISHARDLSTAMEDQWTRLQIGFGERGNRVALFNRELEELKSLVRDFRQGMLRRKKRTLRFGEQTVPYEFGLRTPVSKITRYEDWFSAAREMILGDADIVARGGSPMANPSAAEIETVLATAETAFHAVKKAKRALTVIREEVEVTRAAVENLHRDLARFLRFSLGDLSKHRRRSIMRTMGFSFISDTGKEIHLSAGSTESDAKKENSAINSNPTPDQEQHQTQKLTTTSPYDHELLEEVFDPLAITEFLDEEEHLLRSRVENYPRPQEETGVMLRLRSKTKLRSLLRKLLGGKASPPK